MLLQLVLEMIMFTFRADDKHCTIETNVTVMTPLFQQKENSIHLRLTFSQRRIFPLFYIVLYTQITLQKPF